MIDKKLIRESEESIVFIKKNVLMQILSLLCNIMITIIFAYILSASIEGKDVNNIFAVIIIAVISIILRFIFNKKATLYAHKSSENIKLVLREKIFSKLLELGASYKKYKSTAELVQFSIEGVEQLDVYFARYIPQLFYSLIAPLILFIVIAPFSLIAAFVLFICVPLIPISIIVVQKIAKRILSKYWSDYTGLGDTFLDSVRGLNTFKVFQSEEYQNQKINIEAEKFRKSTMKVLIMQLNSISVMDIVAYGGAGLGIIVGLLNYNSGAVSLFGIILIILLSAEFFLPMRLLGSFFHIAMNGKAASDKIYSLLELDVNNNITAKVENINGNVRFDIESFSINKQILSDIDIEFGVGLNAIVGESGSGKSTIAKLLMKQYGGYSGLITVDGMDIKNINDESYYNVISLVNHQSHIFTGTIRYNLQIASNVTDEQMYKALKNVNLDSFVRVNGGLDMKINANGENLSGGQKQRLALARVLLANRQIIIFDEATSNIDIESEMIINEVIEQLSKSKTVIVIAHRLANVVNAKQINVLSNGHFIESGTHKQLIEDKYKYSEMFSKQKELEQVGGQDEWI